MICYRFFMTLFYRDKLPIMRLSQGFRGFREKGYLFSDIWREGSFILRDLGRKHLVGVLGSRGLRKTFMSWEKGHFSFREQGAKQGGGGGNY